MPSEQSDWFIYCAISQKIVEILYGHYMCDSTNYTIISQIMGRKMENLRYSSVCDEIGWEWVGGK